MAGRKHRLQEYGYMNMDWNKIDDPFERDFAFRSLEATPYCKFCGEQILDASQDAEGKSVNWEWELKNLMHYSCLQDDKAKKAAKARLEAVKEEIRKQDEAENFDWDAYMKDMLDKKE
jgi:hypothetical protein